MTTLFLFLTGIRRGKTSSAAQASASTHTWKQKQNIKTYNNWVIQLTHRMILWGPCLNSEYKPRGKIWLIISCALTSSESMAMKWLRERIMLNHYNGYTTRNIIRIDYSRIQSSRINRRRFRSLHQLAYKTEILLFQ